MSLPPKILEAQIDFRHLRVLLDTGLTVIMPLENVPTLLLATDEERSGMEIFDHSIHWEAIDCDLSVEGLLAGAKEMPGLARKAWDRFLARQYGAAA